MDEDERNYPRVMSFIAGLDENGHFKYPVGSGGFIEEGCDPELASQLRERMTFSYLDLGLMLISSEEAVFAQVALRVKETWREFETRRPAKEALEDKEAEEISKILKESLEEQIKEINALKLEKEMAEKPLFFGLVGLYSNLPNR
ncbi:MAG: hypothetical protein A3E80_01670 [Chlamydiae bacterium RIFCSPHIGHO2_12_FULL_49_9]|nr:MAG: hypothetical protein A3E80_01670 [Chlamydiae bacterium RIFCSPHIGHO2_12_FULL_49_9]